MRQWICAFALLGLFGLPGCGKGKNAAGEGETAGGGKADPQALVDKFCACKTPDCVDALEKTAEVQAFMKSAKEAFDANQKGSATPEQQKLVAAAKRAERCAKDASGK